MEKYMIKEGKRLRLGYTTGSCAAAAAKAAAVLLLTGRAPDTISLRTPGGVLLELAVEEARAGKDWAECAVKKDAGDDPDVTNGTPIVARVSRWDGGGVDIDGGQGVGRVTAPGLDQPVGAAAINSVPRQMIRACVEEVQALADHRGGLRVVISAPEGEALAKRTFNPRLGIQGGISILGTTGIVEPMSEKALVDTIAVELRQRREQGAAYALLTPGNYGADFIREGLGLDPDRAVQVSNFIGDGVDLCRQLGFRGALLVGHVGKLVKLAGGMLNTHSKYGDCRMEILAAHAASCGLGPEEAERVLSCVSCDGALDVLEEAGLAESTLERVTDRAALHLAGRAGEDLETGMILFSKTRGVLGSTPNAEHLLAQIRRS